MQQLVVGSLDPQTNSRKSPLTILAHLSLVQSSSGLQNGKKWEQKHLDGGGSCWTSCRLQQRKHLQQQQTAVQQTQAGSRATCRLSVTPLETCIACRTNYQRQSGRRSWHCRYSILQQPSRRLLSYLLAWIAAMTQHEASHTAQKCTFYPVTHMLLLLLLLHCRCLTCLSQCAVSSPTAGSSWPSPLYWQYVSSCGKEPLYVRTATAA